MVITEYLSCLLSRGAALDFKCISSTSEITDAAICLLSFNTSLGVQSNHNCDYVRGKHTLDSTTCLFILDTFSSIGFCQYMKIFRRLNTEFCRQKTQTKNIKLFFYMCLFLYGVLKVQYKRRMLSLL